MLLSTDTGRAKRVPSLEDLQKIPGSGFRCEDFANRLLFWRHFRVSLGIAVWRRVPRVQFVSSRFHRKRVSLGIVFTVAEEFG